MDNPIASRGVSRRSLMQAALVTPVVAAVPAVTAQSAHADSGRYGRFDTVSPRFSLAVLPDTQYLFDADSADPAPLAETFHYLVKERKDSNIAFMTHLGDITEHGRAEEMALADRTFRALDGALPYSVLAGNHDVGGSDQRGDTAYLEAFGPHRFAAMPTFGGASPDGYNSFHIVEAAGYRWLILALDWRLSEAGFAWAQGVLRAHPTLPTILTTHELAYADESGKAELSGYGQQLWDQLVKVNDQIFLTLNGHFWPPGRTALKNDAGNDVHVHITNYQDRYYGGAAMVRLYSFDLARGVIDVETFSPWFLARDPEKRNQLEAETIELTSDVDRFSIPLVPAERFKGFAPAPVRPVRPASAFMPRGTAAYWRFDAAGLSVNPTPGAPVAAGVVAKDLTGNGNDLVARLLDASPATVLAASDDHHPAAPSRASVRFDGGQAPTRGGLFEAKPTAPINSMKFDSGYTIELFMKLPDPFEGNHSWMGIFSWEGKNRDAGKTTGYSQNDPSCGLNLSPEGFLQYAVYPHLQDIDHTSWSHALSTGKWMHIAVVNDGLRTNVFVDSSKIVRNPSGASTGIATLGKPFVLGGTQSNESFYQGFYGWLGDVRISTRALQPKDFLNA